MRDAVPSFIAERFQRRVEQLVDQAIEGFGNRRSIAFVQFDAFNAGDTEATITVRSPETREATFTVGPGEVRRLRTNWTVPSSKVALDFKNGQGLLFDNLSFRED